MEAAGYAAAILIGISLGLMGGGGSILTVPVLVYIMHVNPVLATTYSLFVVGSCSLVGGARAFLKGLIDFTTVLYFGISSLLTVFLVRYYVVPAIPETFMIGHTAFTKADCFMLLFALLMLLAAFSMIRPKKEETALPVGNTSRIAALLIQGILVGTVTGLLGAGGGFLIIPSLVLFSKLPMKMAVGSSLTIIAISSLFGFFSTASQYTINWMQLVSFTAASITGIFIGVSLSDKIPGATLKKGFGWFVLSMGLYIITREIFFS